MAENVLEGNGDFVKGSGIKRSAVPAGLEFGCFDLPSTAVLG
jgi:hypothetical protein